MCPKLFRLIEYLINSDYLKAGIYASYTEEILGTLTGEGTGS